MTLNKKEKQEIRKYENVFKNISYIFFFVGLLLFMFWTINNYEPIFTSLISFLIFLIGSIGLGILFGVLLGFLAVLIYILFSFRYKYLKMKQKEK